jgi:hypothetical protein
MIFVCFLVVSIRELCLACIAVGRIEFHGRRYVEGEMSIGICFVLCFLQSRRNTGWLAFSVSGVISAGGLLSFCVLGDDAAGGLLSFYVLGDTAAGGLLRNPCLDV